jgi:hypothetical protein
MRLHIDVQEGDWAGVSYGSYGGGFSWTLDELIQAGEFVGDEGVGRWLDLDRRMCRDVFEISVPDSDLGVMTVGELTSRCLAEARRRGLAEPDPSAASDSEPLAPPSSPARTGNSLPRFGDRIMDVWLSDAATDERLPAEHPVGATGVTDGDLLVLSIEHPAEACYSMAAPRNPDELFRWLQLAENSTAPAGGPRLWGVLLYTDADVELATYVRTHFDDLNVLSGPATRIFVVERRANWPAAKKYWRRHLEPELYRVMSTMHWLRWTPYDPQGAYEVAGELGIGSELLPCLVLFHAPRTRRVPHDPRGRREAEKVVFRIEHTSTAYFRSLFGAIDQVLRPFTDALAARQAEELSQGLRDWSALRYDSPGFSPSEHAPAPDAVNNLLAPGPTADAAAFAAVREAQNAITAALRKLVPPAVGLAVSNSLVVVSGTGGTEVSENFSFQGENTTFINRPQDTVIRDFQNSYATTARADDLTQLLRLVLASRDMAVPDRDAAAGEIHDLARLGTAPEPDLPSARTRLERLRTLLASGSDIAQPALAILGSLTAFFSA